MSALAAFSAWHGSRGFFDLILAVQGARPARPRLVSDTELARRGLAPVRVVAQRGEEIFLLDHRGWPMRVTPRFGRRGAARLVGDVRGVARRLPRSVAGDDPPHHRLWDAIVLAAQGAPWLGADEAAQFAWVAGLRGGRA